jgi:hypothetical protein
VLTPIALPHGGQIQAARSPGGKIVAAAGTQIFRYLRDGGFDKGFGERGSIRIRSVEGLPLPEDASIVGLAVDPQARVVVALGGSAIVRTTPEGVREIAGSAILRFTSRGVPDSSFGGGDGQLVTDFGLPGPVNSRFAKGGGFVSALELDPVGRIVVAGSTAVCNCGYDGVELAGFAARLLDDGSVDGSFGSGGNHIFATAAKPEYQVSFGLIETIVDLALDGSSVVVAASSESKGQVDWQIGRLDESGSPNLSFGVSGLLPVGETRGLALDDEGRIISLARDSVWRFLPDGTLDSTFGVGGGVQVLAPGLSALEGVTVGPENRLLVTGSLARRLSPRRGDVDRRLVFALIGSRGRLDRRAGKNGLLSASFGRREQSIGIQALSGGNKVTVIGRGEASSSPTGVDLGLIRIRLRR